MKKNQTPQRYQVGGRIDSGDSDAFSRMHRKLKGHVSSSSYHNYNEMTYDRVIVPKSKKDLEKYGVRDPIHDQPNYSNRSKSINERTNRLMQIPKPDSKFSSSRIRMN